MTSFVPCTSTPSSSSAPSSSERQARIGRPPEQVLEILSDHPLRSPADPGRFFGLLAWVLLWHLWLSPHPDLAPGCCR